MATFSFLVSLPVVSLSLYSTPSSGLWRLLASFSFLLVHYPLWSLVSNNNKIYKPKKKAVHPYNWVEFHNEKR